jgi:hypothetical protein
VKKEKGGGKALNLKLNMELSKIKQPPDRKEVISKAMKLACPA